MNADTVAVQSCPEMDGVKLCTLAWELEKTGTDLCVARDLRLDTVQRSCGDRIALTAPLT